MNEVEQHQSNVSCVEVNIVRREIWIDGLIQGGTSREVILGLREMYYLHSETPISIFINSEGGDPIEALAIADYIALLNKTLVVKTNVIGNSYSAAILISTAGTKGYRSALPSADFLVHGLAITGLGGDVDKVEAQSRQMIRLNNKIRNHLVLMSGQRPVKIDRMMSRESFFNVKEAIRLGFLDKAMKLERRE